MVNDTLRPGKILLLFWHQYGRVHKSPEGVIYLDHLPMSAGEAAAELLVELGLCIGLTRKCGITTKGLRLMELEGYLGYDEFLAINSSDI